MIEFKKEEWLKKEIERLTRITKGISFIRLILALNLILWLICLLSLQSYLLYGLASAVSFAAMLVFVLLTNRYFHSLNLKRKKEKVYLLHHKRRKLDFSSFVDEGRDFLNKEDYKLSDLDIFGPKSLFQYLNVAKTKLGRDALAAQLTNPLPKEERFRECISEFAQSEDTLELEAGFLTFDESAKHINYEEFNSIFTKTIPFQPLFLLPVLSFLATLTYLVLIFAIGMNPYPLIAFFLLNFITARVCLRNDVYDLDALKYYTLCESYAFLSETVLRLNYKSTYYQAMKEQIRGSLPALQKIKKVYLALSSRKNIIANFILNSLCIYDLWTILVYNRLVKSIQSLDELFKSISEIEVMASFSVLGIDNALYCIPTEGREICGTRMYHPLVKNCVANDFSLQGGVVLTGSNMSGKTTFMRTVGINQLLYNAGSIVCASGFSSSFLPIYTSLRANDMLSEGISTFYAEILRMKKMNEAIPQGNCLILVDEIFKGTNAYERIQASFKVIDKFNDYHVLFIISTHDFELCEAKNILNYHFNEQYEGDKITFDYKIKEGMCTSSNALYLLKMAGII